MTIGTEFESIIVCRKIIDLRFKGGWAEWLNKFSMQDDGELSRVSSMSGSEIADIEYEIYKLGLLPPKITKTAYQYRDYFIYAMEYQPHKKYGISIGGSPDWLIWHEPLIQRMSLFEIDKLPIEAFMGSPARPTFSFNRKVTI